VVAALIDEALSPGEVPIHHPGKIWPRITPSGRATVCTSR
jgi:hypothetical protein